MTPFRRVHPILRVVLLAGLIAGSLAVGALALRASAPVGAFTTKGAYKFVSAAGLHPPKLKVLTHKSGLARGDFLVANLPNEAAPGRMTGEGGPLILDSNLKPVWVQGVGTRVAAANLQQESYAPCGAATCAEPVLVWWEGLVNSHGVTTQGKVLVDDQHYRRVATLSAKAPWVISLHDASIDGANIWVTAYRTLRNQNLAPYGGAKKAPVLDVALQEYNLKTGKLIRSWDALNPGHKAHLPLSASKQPPPTAKQSKAGEAWDAYHLNSVQALPDGNILVSMRNTWGVYLINPVTGKILWTLGGKHSTLRLSGKAKFAWQHDAELTNSRSTGIGTNEELTLFDDNCCKVLSSGGLGKPNGPSRGLVLRLNTVTGTASLVRSFTHKPPFNVAFLGSAQLVEGGNAVVGWGSLPYFSEFTRSGKEILFVKWPGKDESYRALFTSSWVGLPNYPPSAKVKKSTVYVSWNGATQVAKWRVLAGNSSNSLKPVKTSARGGFETAIKLSKSYSAYEVQALDSKGAVLPHGSKTFG
jgi:Arylsulfotransferase (ASST)